MKVKLLKTEFEAEVTTGKIQFGAVLGAIAQVIEPAVWAPVASLGTDPIPPGTVLTPGVLLPAALVTLLLLQAASAVMLATAMAMPPTALMRDLIIGPPSSRCSCLF